MKAKRKEDNKRQRSPVKRRSPPTTDNTIERRIQLIELLLHHTLTQHEIYTQLQTYYDSDYLYHASTTLPEKARRKLASDIKFLKAQKRYTLDVDRPRRNVVARYHLHSDTLHLLSLDPKDIETLALLRTIFLSPWSRNDGAIEPSPRTPRHPFAQALNHLIDVIATYLSVGQQETMARLATTPTIYLNMDTVNSYIAHQQVIERLARAIKEHRQVRYRYHRSRNETAQTIGPLDPHRLLAFEGHFYLYAFNHHLSMQREYRIDRIDPQSVELSPTTFAPRAFHAIAFRYWVDALLMRDGASERWITQVEEQRQVMLIDGQPVERVLIHATAFNEWRIIQQLLRYGSRVELVEPLSLREQFHQEIMRILRHYEHQTSE